MNENDRPEIEELRPDTTIRVDSFFALFRQWNKTHAFDKALFARTLKMLGAYDSRVFIAKEGEKIIGYVQINRCLQVGFEPYIEITQLLISRDRQRRGIGTRLMQKAEEIARAEGFSRVKLESEIQRPDSHLFYENIGYKLQKTSKFFEKRI